MSRVNFPPLYDIRCWMLMFLEDGDENFLQILHDKNVSNLKFEKEIPKISTLWTCNEEFPGNVKILSIY